METDASLVHEHVEKAQRQEKHLGLLLLESLPKGYCHDSRTKFKILSDIFDYSGDAPLYKVLTVVKSKLEAFDD